MVTLVRVPPSQQDALCFFLPSYRQTNYVEVVRVAVDDLAAFEQALQSGQSRGRGRGEQDVEGSNSQPTAHSGKGKKGNQNGAKKGDAKQAQEGQAQAQQPKLQWLSEAEMLAACKGGRGNKEGGGLGLVGLSTGPRKIFGLLSKAS